MATKRKSWSRAKKVDRYGYHFQSKAECAFADELQGLLREGRIAGWAYEPRIFDLRVGEHHIARYTPDFIINHNNGSDEIVEVKGWWKPDAKLRVKLFQALYPKFKFRVVGTPMDKRRRPEK